MVLLSNSPNFRRIKRSNNPASPSCAFLLVRRSVYEQHGGFDTSFRIAADYDCMLRFLGRTGNKDERV